MFLRRGANRVLQFIDGYGARRSPGQPLDLTFESLRLAGLDFDRRDKWKAKVLLAVSLYLEVPTHAGDGPG